jgi:hypothetical protein
MSYVRETLDLSDVLKELQLRFEEVGRELGKDEMSGMRMDAFSRLGRKMGRIRGWSDSRKTRENEESGTDGGCIDGK